jgi:hypothetical protein
LTTHLKFIKPNVGVTHQPSAAGNAADAALAIAVRLGYFPEWKGAK